MGVDHGGDGIVIDVPVARNDPLTQAMPSSDALWASFGPRMPRQFMNSGLVPTVRVKICERMIFVRIQIIVNNHLDRSDGSLPWFS